jgi:hypothetical protein
MKKIAFVLAAFMFAATAIAGTVTMTIVDNGDHTADITYVADANVSAFALDVNVDNGNITGISNYFEGECDDVNKGYGIFLGTIEILESGDVNDWGTPIADPCDLPSDTKPGLGNNGVTVEMGALYTHGRQPSRTGTLCTLTVSADCNMTVTGNVGRGKVVQEDGAQATLVGDTQSIIMAGCTMPNVIGLTEAAAITAITGAGLPSPTVVDVPDNANVGDVVAQTPAAGGPIDCGTATTIDVGYAYASCWDQVSQCHGDADANSFINTDDWPAFRDSFYKQYPDAAYNPCGDYNRSGRVDTDDWPAFRDNFYQSVDTNCVTWYSSNPDPCGVYAP